MRWILTALIFLFGLFDLFMGLNFLFNPQATATGFGLEATGTQGMSTLRADFAAFFGVVAICMMLGAWRRNGDLLLVPAALMGTAVTVRAISLALDGTYPGWQCRCWSKRCTWRCWSPPGGCCRTTRSKN